MRCRVSSLIPARPCNARSTVPMDTSAISAINWIPRLFFFIRASDLDHAAALRLVSNDNVYTTLGLAPVVAHLTLSRKIGTCSVLIGVKIPAIGLSRLTHNMQSARLLRIQSLDF